MAETAEGLDVKALQGKQDKIKELMRRDPKFIARLISVSKFYRLTSMCLCPNAAARHMHAWCLKADSVCSKQTCICHPSAHCVRKNQRTSSKVMSNLLHHIPCVVLQQLDKQMHKMLLEKHKRCEEIKADQAALDKIDATITTQIQPCLVSAAGRSPTVRRECICRPPSS